MAKKKKRTQGVSIIEMVVILVVVLVLFVILINHSKVLEEKNQGYEQKIENLEKEITKEKEREEELKELESNVQTKEYAGKIAKERLGLVGEDEVIFRPED